MIQSIVLVGPVVTLGPSHSVVDEGVGSLVFDLTTSLEVSITVQTVSGSAGIYDYSGTPL